MDLYTLLYTMNTEIDFAGIKMKNPVTVASGTFGYGREYNNFFDLSNASADNIPAAQPSNTSVFAFNVTNKNGTGNIGQGVLSVIVSKSGYQDKKVHFATNVSCASS